MKENSLNIHTVFAFKFTIIFLSVSGGFLLLLVLPCTHSVPVSPHCHMIIGVKSLQEMHNNNNKNNKNNNNDYKKVCKCWALQETGEKVNNNDSTGKK